MSRYPDFAGKLQLAFTGGRIERESGRRHDADWCAALLADAASRTYALVGEQIVECRRCPAGITPAPGVGEE